MRADIKAEQLVQFGSHRSGVGREHPKFLPPHRYLHEVPGLKRGGTEPVSIWS